MLVVESSSQMVIGMKILSTEKQSFEELIQSVPNHFLKLFEKAGIRPITLECNSDATGHLLREIGQSLQVMVDIFDELPVLDRIMATMPF
jgi:hypothetical protein